MQKTIVTFIFSVFIFGCASQSNPKKKPNGQWVWAQQELNPKADQDKVSEAEWKRKFETAKNTCKIESLKAPIPPPDCSTTNPTNNCSMYGGMALNFCFKQRTYKKCDLESVNTYKDALFNALENCMIAFGWQWQPFENKPNSMQQVVESIPQLALWQKKDPERWNLSISIDEGLIALPQYEHMSTRDRLLIVVEKVNKRDL